jgi:homocysteine S-methyltransferase
MTGILQQPLILMEGAVIERLRRDGTVPLDPQVLNAALLFSAEGREALASVYTEYIAVGRESGLPLLLLTPTWRANPERCDAAGLEFKAVQREAFAFLDALRRRQGDYAKKILIGGLMGCRGDAYDPKEGLQEKEASRFHAPQAEALASGGVEFLIASTLPAMEEAAGLGRAMGGTSLSFILSFVLRADGALLDGTLFHQAVVRLDGLSPKPLGHMVNCTHPANLLEGMGMGDNARPEIRARLLGLQGNTSLRSPEELDGAAELEGEDPETFGVSMAEAARLLRLRILGGCCGTDARHLRAIARLL